MTRTDPPTSWLEGLRTDPCIFPHELDPVNRRLLLVQLSESKIRQASFLDARVLEGNEPGGWLPLARALESTPPNPGPAGIILHCGHCGSTLLSRLLGELPGVWVLREPLALHALASEARARGHFTARLTAGEFEASLALVQSALGRLPRNAASAIVKQTSLTANLGPLLLERPSPPAVLCLSIPLEDYLATMLRQPGLREGVRRAAGEWSRDIAEALADNCPTLAELSDAELAALNWTAARLNFEHTRVTGGACVLAWTFEDFLAEPEARLGELARHFGLEADEQSLARAIASPWLRRYAKDPRQPFDATTRRQELREAKRQFAHEIRAGRRFADDLRRRISV